MMMNLVEPKTELFSTPRVTVVLKHWVSTRFSDLDDDMIAKVHIIARHDSVLLNEVNYSLGVLLLVVRCMIL